jgi:hypothetical protein
MNGFEQYPEGVDLTKKKKMSRAHALGAALGLATCGAFAIWGFHEAFEMLVEAYGPDLVIPLLIEAMIAAALYSIFRREGS